MDNRNMQVARIFQVLAILQSSRNGKSVTEIEAALIDRGFEVQKRTVYRDIDALETAGFPINRDEGALLEGEQPDVQSVIGLVPTVLSVRPIQNPCPKH